MSKNVRQFVLPLITAIIWGGAFLAQGDLTVLPSFFVNAVRSVIGIVALLVVDFSFTAVKRAKKIPVEKTDYKKLFIGGTLCGIAMFAAVYLQQEGMKGGIATGTMTDGEAAFITALYMIMVAVVGVFFKKNTGLNVWIAVVISLVGLFLICDFTHYTFTVNHLLVILCAVGYTAQIMIIDHYVQFVDGVKLSCVQLATVMVLSFVCSLIFERGTLDLSSAQNVIFPFLYLGVLSSAGAYTLQIIAQKGTNPTCVSLLLCLESFFALVIGTIRSLIQGNFVPLSTAKYIGCALILVSVLLSQVNPFALFKKKGEKTDTENV